MDPQGSLWHIGKAKVRPTFFFGPRCLVDIPLDRLERQFLAFCGRAMAQIGAHEELQGMVIQSFPSYLTGYRSSWSFLAYSRSRVITTITGSRLVKCFPPEVRRSSHVSSSILVAGRCADRMSSIWPRTRIMDWFRILSDPDPPELARMLQVGQIVTWPKVTIPL